MHYLNLMFHGVEAILPGFNTAFRIKHRKLSAFLGVHRDLSDNRVLVELIEQGIEAQQQKEKAFFQLAKRFRAASDPEQVKQLGDQLGRFVFGE